MDTTGIDHQDDRQREALTPAVLAQRRGIDRDELLARLRSYEQQTRHLHDDEPSDG